MLEVGIATDHGNISIREDQLASLTQAELKKFRVSRESLQRIFKVAAELMQGVKPSDRVRPCAAETLDGNWEVRLVRYSELTDPMLDKPLGTA